jgi:O-antigen/teichoic acid export membrane protein
MYVVLAIFPKAALGIFGHRYETGAACLAVLSIAMLVNLGTGNVTVVLLMGGKSSWNIVNAGAALAINVGLNLILLPRMGITGAAVAWAASIVVDNVAAVIEVRWLLGLAPFGRSYLLAAASALGCFGATGLAARFVLGTSTLAAVVGAAAGLIIYVALIFAVRSQLNIPALSQLVRPRPARLAER